MSRLLLSLLAVLLLDARPAAAVTVNVATVSGGINPAIANYLEQAIAESERAGVEALVIELDTPGGLVSSTKDIVSAILNAKLPVIVFVSPRGAWAASAGTFITLAGHVAAMAPGTSIGAAHPVPLFGAPPAPPPEPGAEKRSSERGAPRDVATEKAENFVTAFIQSIAQERGRNVEWVAEAVRESKAITQKEALQKRVIDLAADDLDELLVRLHGRKVKLGREVVVLDTEGAAVHRLPMPLVHRFFDVISDPQIALLLILAGLLGLYVEFTQPGLIFPGVAGAAALLLAGLALQVIPFNWIGLLLIIAGVALLVAELFVTSFGLLFAAGLSCLAFGAYVLFDVPSESDLRVPFWEVIFPAVAAVAIFGGIVVIGISRTMLRRQVVGAEGLLGEVAVADSDIAPEGRVFLHGELWTARSSQPIAKGEPVEITRVSDLVVHVRRHEGEEKT